jgi:hypothetical protein
MDGAVGAPALHAIRYRAPLVTTSTAGLNRRITPPWNVTSKGQPQRASQVQVIEGRIVSARWVRASVTRGDVNVNGESRILKTGVDYEGGCLQLGQLRG